MEFFTLKCVKFSNTFKLFDCGFRRLADSHYVFSIRAKPSKDLDERFFFRYIIDVEAPFKNKNILHFIDTKVKACDVTQRDYDIPLLTNIVSEIKKSANFPYRCPFKKV